MTPKASGTFSNTLRGLDEWGVRSNNGDSRRVDRWTFNTPIPAGRPIEVLIKGTDPAKNEVQTNNGTAASSASDVWRQIKSSSQTLEYVAVSSFFSNTVGCIIKAVRWGDTQEEFNLPADLSYESPEITLTFADSTNLDKFQVGDVVVDKEFATKTTTSTLFSGSYPTTQMYNGSEVPATTDWTLVSHTADSFIKAEGLSIPGTQIGLTIGNGFDLEIYVNGQLVDADYDPPAWNTAISTAYYTIPGGLLTSFEVKATSAAGGQGWGICSVYVDGSILIEGTSVSIVSVDPANNQMVVDGGEWDTSNQSQVWRDNVTAPDLNRGTFANLFDGNLDTAAGRESTSTSPTPEEGWTLTFDNPISNVKKVEIKPYKLDGSARYCEYQVNSESIVQQTSEDWLTLYDNDSAPITVNSIFCRQTTPNASATWRAIKIDGKLLVDPFNDSQVWSNGTTVGTYQGDRTIDRAFDGNTTTFAQRENVAGTTVYTFATPVPVTGAVTFKAMAENSTCKVYLTGPKGDSTAVTDTGSDGIEVSADVSAEIGNTINSVTFTKSSSGASRLYEIHVDGKLLVDKGIRDLGDSKVSKTSTYEASLICSDDTELANMIGPISMTDGNGDLITPQTSEITNVVSY